MKIIVFTDIHGDLFALEEVRMQAKNADLAICLGDISYFEHDIDFLVDVLNGFPIPVLLLHGNHEQKETIELLCEHYPNVHFMHEKIFEKDNFIFMGYGGDGFSKSDSKFLEWSKSIEKSLDFEKTILLLHGPPYNTNLDVPIEGTHCGNKTTRKFIDRNKPLLVLAGHIHECEERDDWIEETYLLNPGPFGYIIDLNVLKKERSKIKNK